MRISDWSSDVCSSDLYTRSAAGWPRQELRQVALQGLAHHLPAGAEIALQAVDQRVVVAAGDEQRQGALVVGGRMEQHQPAQHAQIGRASCRERVCQYV